MKSSQLAVSVNRIAKRPASRTSREPALSTEIDRFQKRVAFLLPLIRHQLKRDGESSNGETASDRTPLNEDKVTDSQPAKIGTQIVPPHEDELPSLHETVIVHKKADSPTKRNHVGKTKPSIVEKTVTPKATITKPPHSPKRSVRNPATKAKQTRPIQPSSPIRSLRKPSPRKENIATSPKVLTKPTKTTPVDRIRSPARGRSPVQPPELFPSNGSQKKPFDEWLRTEVLKFKQVLDKQSADPPVMPKPSRQPTVEKYVQSDPIDAVTSVQIASAPMQSDVAIQAQEISVSTSDEQKNPDVVMTDMIERPLPRDASHFAAYPYIAPTAADMVEIVKRLSDDNGPLQTLSGSHDPKPGNLAILERFHLSASKVAMKEMLEFHANAVQVVNGIWAPFGAASTSEPAAQVDPRPWTATERCAAEIFKGLIDVELCALSDVINDFVTNLYAQEFRSSQ